MKIKFLLLAEFFQSQMASGSNSNDKTGLPPGFRSVKSPPPPSFRPPPPLAPPPVAPASPMTQRKLSVNAPFKPSPGASPNPPPGGFLPKRPVEKMEETKIARFGERLKSPGPGGGPGTSTPPQVPVTGSRQFSPVNGGLKLNGHGHPEVDFLSLLEKEEADFAEQIKKQKSFLQGVFKDKEELAQLCVNQSNKMAKLEHERTEWQRKIIETEREKRDYLERLDGEQQAHR